MFIMFTFPFSYKYIIKCFNSQLDYPVCATVSLSVSASLLIDTYVYYLCAVCVFALLAYVATSQ